MDRRRSLGAGGRTGLTEGFMRMQEGGTEPTLRVVLAILLHRSGGPVYLPEFAQHVVIKRFVSL